jgi:2'-5' RNA ligase
LILTARILDADLAPFEQLRQRHFPPARNVLRAHVTMFYRISHWYAADVRKALDTAAACSPAFDAHVIGLRHLGSGVACEIDSEELQHIRADLQTRFRPWLSPQDLRSWHPHITVQNGVSRAQADLLYDQLQADFATSAFRITGLDLWTYLGGPWKPEGSFDFSGNQGSDDQGKL